MFVACALSACFPPIRYDALRAPKISGKLLDGTIPLRQQYVILSTGAYRPFVQSGAVNCGSVTTITKTDDTGDFAFQAVEERVTVYNPWDYPPGAYWSVCVERDGVRRPILSQLGRTGEVPRSLQVRCNIADAETTIETIPPIVGRCKIDPP